MNIDPNTTKYVITATISTDGVVEKPDVVGAIFGQTEGLLGEELDLRELQKTGRIGRIEVDIASKKGKSEGSIILPSSLDQVETAILASALETIERVGPCKAHIGISDIDDVRAKKKKQIVDRAKDLLSMILEKSKTAGLDISETVRQAVQMEEIVSYGNDKCPAGPTLETSDDIIVVEGRSDVINLLKYGIKNSIAVEGTNIPKTVIDLSKERVVTAFVDGDRGGELIIRELLQRAEVDFIARAPPNTEVEELTLKQMMKSIRNKMPVDQYISIFGLGDDNGSPQNGGKGGKDSNRGKGNKKDGKDNKKDKIDQQPMEMEQPVMPIPEDAPQFSKEQEKYKDTLERLSGKQKAVFFDQNTKVIKEILVKDLADKLKESQREVTTVVFDGIISQRLLDISAEKEVKNLIGVKVGNVIKVPSSVRILTKEDLE
jgi:DNA primase